MDRTPRFAVFLSLALLFAAACSLLAASAAGFSAHPALDDVAHALNARIEGFFGAVSAGTGFDARLLAALALALLLAVRVFSRILRDRRSPREAAPSPERTPPAPLGPPLDGFAPEGRIPQPAEAGERRASDKPLRPARAREREAAAAGTRRRAAQVALAVGGAAVAIMMILLVTYLYFGPGYIDLGPDLRIERGPRKTFFLRIGAVFGAVFLLHAAYFALFFGGGLLAGKFRGGGSRPRRGRKPRAGRAATAPASAPAAGEAGAGAAETPGKEAAPPSPPADEAEGLDAGGGGSAG